MIVFVYTLIFYSVPPQLSLQLFDARHELHKTTCNYALELNSLHSKTTPDFLNRIVRRERGREGGGEREHLADSIPKQLCFM